MRKNTPPHTHPPGEPQYACIIGPRMVMSRTDWQAFYNPYSLLLLSLERGFSHKQTSTYVETEAAIVERFVFTLQTI